MSLYNSNSSDVKSPVVKSRFTNPFRRSSKDKRIYNNDDETKNVYLHPQLIPEPNVGYVDDLNIPPLKVDSDYGRKVRSLGTWEKKRAEPIIPENKMIKQEAPINPYNQPKLSNRIKNNREIPYEAFRRFQ